jgi:hypothetical protein
MGSIVVPNPGWVWGPAALGKCHLLYNYGFAFGFESMGREAESLDTCHFLYNYKFVFDFEPRERAGTGGFRYMSPLV